MRKTIRLFGIYRNFGEIQAQDGRLLRWDQLSLEAPPRLPYGTQIEILMHYEECDYLHGSNGIVWATYDLRQAETVRSALLAQNISCELQEARLEEIHLHVLRIPERADVQAAIDFIWREKSGLCLQPDWWYPAGAENSSFKKWINGT